MDWDDVRHFLALARTGSVRAAGKSLGVSHSTVARRVEALEGRLSARLFDRSRDGYILTAAGLLLIGGAERVEQEMSDIGRALAGEDDRLAGAVALTCGDNTVAAMLLDALGALCEAHPAIELHVSVDGRPFDLARREADVAVRALPPGVSPPGYLLGSLVAPVMLTGYRAKATRRTTGCAPDRWLAFEDRRLMERLIAASGHPDLPAWGEFNSVEAIQSATRRGFGLSLLPVYIGDADPELQRTGGAAPFHAADLWLLCHPDLRHTRRVQSVRAAVARAFQEQAARFQGQGWPDPAPARPDSAPHREAPAGIHWGHP